MKYIFFVFFLVALSSCSVKKYQTIPYFIDLPKDSINSEASILPLLIRIQKGDAFTMDVSSQNSMASALFGNSNINGSMETGSSSLKSFYVDNEGNIRIPLAGSIQIEGLTLIEARIKIENQLKIYLKEPVVNLKLTNFRISILGDVARPGAYFANNENINVVEAIALAGDLNITAQRNNILLVRQNEGKREYIRMDIQSKNIFSSPYFYLKSGDVLYVQPGPAKYESIDNKYRNFSAILSVISVLTIIYAQFIR